jgi:hypothetical protein
MPRVRFGTRATLVALSLAVGAILIATLSPIYETPSSEQPWCLLCGERGAADAVDNMLLFAPLGVTLCLLGLTASRAILAGAGLSLLVEIAQFAVVPGRDASPSDLLFNTLGTGLGYAVLRTISRWPHMGARLTGWLAPIAAAIAVSTVPLTGYLLRPSLPRSGYAGQWTESPGNLELYRGTILEATLGSEPVPARPLENSALIRDLLRTGAPLDIRLVAGPPTSRLGQLFAIVQQGSNREVLLLGIDGDDLLLRYRARANDLRLDGAALFVPNALAGLSPGSSVRLVIEGAADGYCVSVNARRTCQLAFTAANAWLVLYSIDSWPAWMRTAISTGWLVALLIPVGFWLRRRWSSLLALFILALGFTVLPGAVGLSPPTAVESVGALLGLLLGMAMSATVIRKG